jgi:two-component system LytT family sensor kinase
VCHAIAPRAGGGSVVVTARRSGSRLVLAVEDDGAVTEEGEAAGRRGSSSEGAGIGLRLIRERLAALYGGAASLDTGRSAQGGFRAAVTLPLSGRSEPPA